MNEASKSIFKKLSDSRYATRYIIGDGIDIGAGSDSIGAYQEFFPLMRSCMAWDLPNGDAQYMESIQSNSFDFVHSSHCLEHMENPLVAINNWVRILKPNGHLICIVPDEDLYEQGIFPSTYNSDHKYTFSIFKKNSWSPRSVNIVKLIEQINFDVEILRIELLDSTYMYKLSRNTRTDQTLTPIGECAIEFILKKI